MTTTAGTEAPPRPRRNPYRGPREFRRNDQLPNRRQEARELTDLVVAERVVLLHSPSGAGKTSLIEAAVVHELEREGFTPTQRLRVNEPPPTDRPIHNRYVYSLGIYLLTSLSDGEGLDQLTLPQVVERWMKAEPPAGVPVLIVDQLEEVLTLDPTDWEAKETFFRELGKLLRRSHIWVLLSMREDYMGGLDRYLRFFPGLLRSRYRLDFLSRPEAKLAIQVPAKAQRVTFTDEAADALLDRLAVVKVQRPGEDQDLVPTRAPYVEPFQLQVVCRQLWREIRKHRGDDFPTIDVQDVELHANVDQALTLYFGDTVTGVVQKTDADERKVRDWFEFDLITKQHFRSQTLTGPATRDADKVLALLEDGYLIRGDVRGQSTWYELTHDRLIGAVLASNEAWRWTYLDAWQIAAYEWDRSNRHPAFLLTPGELKSAPIRRSHRTQVERDFLRASEDEARRGRRLALVYNAMALLAFVAGFEAVVIIGLLIYLFAR
jgi:hypothetical protein